MTERQRQIIESKSGVKMASTPEARPVAPAGRPADATKTASMNEAAARLEAAGYTALDIAKTAGALEAYSEAGFSLKEASEHAGVPENVLQHVLVAVGAG